MLGWFEAGLPRAAGELAFTATLAWPASCEVALSVERPWQDAGLGSELLRWRLNIARTRGVAKVRVLCLRGKRKLQRLASRFAATLVLTGTVVEGVLYPRWPGAGSILEASWADGCALFNLFYALPGVGPPPKA